MFMIPYIKIITIFWRWNLAPFYVARGDVCTAL